MSAGKTGRSARPCPVCGGSRVEMLQHLEYEQFLENLPDCYDIVSCLNCGMVFNDTTAQAEDFERYYAAFSKYESKNIVGAGDFSPMERGRYGRMLRFVAPWLRQDSRIVEVGCGQGGFLRLLKAKGYANLLGVDPSATCIEVLKRNGVPGVTGTLDDPPAIGAVELLALIGVTEHLFHPVQSLASILRQCSDPPLIFLVVPSTRDYGARISTPFYHFDFEHISHFDIHQLNNLMAAIGYQPVEHAYDYISVGEVSNDTLNALYHKADTPSAIRYDSSALQAVKGYLETSRQNDFHAEIARLTKKREPLYLWGCGAHLARLLRSTALPQANIAAFVDNDPHKQKLTLLGKKIIGSPALSGLDSESTVVICSPLYKTVMHEELHNMGFAGRVEMLC